MKDLTKILTKFIIDFSFNYTVVCHEWTTIYGEKKIKFVPKFLTEVNWTCNFDHMLAKWETAQDVAKSGYGFMSKFWAELDNANREALVEWFAKNYPVD